MIRPDRPYKEKEKDKEKEKERKSQYRHMPSPAEENDSRRCSFCGAEMDEDDNFCPECGGARAGIQCLQCGTLSHGSFCPHCNAPLDDLAADALRQARHDRHFIEAERLAGELAVLEAQIEALGRGAALEEPPALDTTSRLSEEDRKVMERYNSLFATSGQPMTAPAPRRTVAPASETARKPKPAGFSVAGITLDQAVARYKAVAAELERELNAMLPEPTATPEEQRNFFSARKIRSSEVRNVRQCWVCNYCGCHHSAPSECYKPWMGGKWIVDTEFGNTTTTTLYD